MLDLRKRWDKMPFEVKYFPFIKLEIFLLLPFTIFVIVYNNWWSFLQVYVYAQVYLIYLSRFLKAIGSDATLLLKTNYFCLNEDKSDIKFQYKFNMKLSGFPAFLKQRPRPIKVPPKVPVNPKIAQPGPPPHLPIHSNPAPVLETIGHMANFSSSAITIGTFLGTTGVVLGCCNYSLSDIGQQKVSPFHDRYFESVLNYHVGDKICPLSPDNPSLKKQNFPNPLSPPYYTVEPSAKSGYNDVKQFIVGGRK